MKNISKLISGIVCLSLILSSFTAFALEEGISELNSYDINDKSIESIFIPASVTAIGTGLFRDCKNLTTVTVSPENPVYYSQGNCVIEKATGKLVAGCSGSVIPDTVSAIGDYAFFSCPDLMEIEIPQSVRYIGKKAFSNCTGLTRMHLPDSVRYIDDQVFNECTALKELTLSNSLTYLPVGMCYKCSSLEKLVIPPSVTSVEGNIFQGAGLQQGVYIPSSIKNVAASSFSNHRYTPFYYEGTFNEWKKIEAFLDPLFTDYIQEGLRCLYPYEEKLVYVDDNLSCNIKVVNGEGTIETVNYAIGDVVVPDEVEGYPITKIEIAAFAAKQNLTSVTFPDSIVQMGNRCFYNSDSLTSVTFPEGIEEIPDGFFLSCDGIEDIGIPDSVKRIGNSAFGSCSKIKSITIPESVTYIDNAAFKNCANLEEVILPESGVSFGSSVFAENPRLKNITLPRDLKVIPSSMFNLSAVEEITIPEGVTIISTYAFSGSDLKHITVPGSVKAIGEGAFGGCKKLETAIVENGCAELYRNAFGLCPSLTSVTLPHTLTMVDGFAFAQSPLIKDVCYTIKKPDIKITFNSPVTERIDENQVTYTFDSTGGKSVSPTRCNTGIDYARYTEKDGYVLLGWSLSPEDNAPLITYPFYSNKDVILYAKWAKREDCIIMKINEKEASLYGKTVTNDVAPIISNGRTMLPVRFVAESLGATVEWNNDARYIRIVGDDGNVIDMRVDEKGTFAKGYYNELDVPPFVHENRTYTPVRFVAESLGAKVYWINETQEVVIIK